MLDSERLNSNLEMETLWIVPDAMYGWYKRVFMQCSAYVCWNRYKQLSPAVGWDPSVLYGWNSSLYPRDSHRERLVVGPGGSYFQPLGGTLLCCMVGVAVPRRVGSDLW